MSKKLRELQSRKADAAKAKAEHLKAAGDLLDRGASENRDLTTEEQASFNDHKAKADAKGAEIDRFQAQIDVEQELITAQAQAGTVVVLPGDGSAAHVEENVDKDKKWGFKSPGDFFKAVAGAGLISKKGGSIDQRLAAAPSSFGGEGTGADGGFAVPPEFAKEIFVLSLGENALLPYTDEVNVTGNNMSFPKDETTPWGTDGIRAYWQGEAVAGTPTKPALGLTSLRLKKLMALTPVSDELLEDASALSTYLPKKMGVSIQWKINDAILNGPGGNMPNGALNSGAAIVVAKDSGQATKTLSATNLANMMARLPEGSFGRAVWIINNDALPALFTLSLGNYPIYLPIGMAGGGMQGNPYGMLLGRPIIVSQHAASFTSQGDVNLVDLQYYQAITKGDGVEMATSLHLYFDADAVAFRAMFRMDGISKLSKSITPKNGSNNLSPFVQLGAR